MQYIEADDLELETKQKDPVRYHEAWTQLCSCQGVLIPGGFGLRGIEGKIVAAEWARKQKKPFLGPCRQCVTYYISV
jgi:CTP synthase